MYSASRSTSATARHCRRSAVGPNSSPSSPSPTPARCARGFQRRSSVELRLRHPDSASAPPLVVAYGRPQLHVGVTHTPGLFPLFFLPLLCVGWLTGVSSAALAVANPGRTPIHRPERLGRLPMPRPFSRTKPEPEPWPRTRLRVTPATRRRGSFSSGGQRRRTAPNLPRPPDPETTAPIRTWADSI